VEVTNPWGKSALSTIDFTIRSVNDVPVVEEIPEPIELRDIREISGQVIATDVDCDPLSYAVSQAPQHGTFAIHEDGSWTYEVEGYYLGLDHAMVMVEDGNGGVVSNIVRFNAVVSPPVVGDLSLDLLEDGSISSQLSVTNAVGGALVYTVSQTPSNGAFLIQDDGTFSYDPSSNYNGSDQAIVTVTNDYGLSSTAVLGFTVQPVNDIPLVQEPEELVLFGVPNLQGQIDAADVDGDQLTYKLNQMPGHGTFMVDPEGRWTYTPESGYMGEDHVELEVNDGNGGVAHTSLHFTINIYEGGDLKIENPTEAVLLKNVSKDDLSFTRWEGDLRIEIREKGSLILTGYFETPESGINRIETMDGPLYLGKDRIQIMEPGPSPWRPCFADGVTGFRNLIYGTSGIDFIQGAGYSDVLFGADNLDYLNGRDGNDTLIGGSGIDFLNGKEGHDTLYGDAGSDLLKGGAGDDSLIGGDDSDLLEGEGGTDRLYGNEGIDLLIGDEGNDLLTGGRGDDTLKGGAGDDLYLFRPGDGRDLLWDQNSRCSGSDTVLFGQEVTMLDVAFYQHGNSLFVQYGEQDVLEIFHQKKDSDKIERIELANGSYLTDAEVNVVIQQICAYASQEGIHLKCVEDVRMNQEMMTIIANSWHQ
jgi:hypothetical protein